MLAHFQLAFFISDSGNVFRSSTDKAGKEPGKALAQFAPAARVPLARIGGPFLPCRHCPPPFDCGESAFGSVDNRDVSARKRCDSTTKHNHDYRNRNESLKPRFSERGFPREVKSFQAFV